MLLQALQGIGQQVRSVVIAMRCPGCRQIATFDGAIPHDAGLLYNGQIVQAGLRVCPNPSCRTVIYFIWDVSVGNLLASYPPERLDFDSANIPASITKALEEAITCHANECFIAGAIMVRKTLEELCHDRGTKGNNLKERLRNLGTAVILPQELLGGLDDLRLLGNDAAHIESQEYSTVGKEEVGVGIEFTKEVLKAVFQYSNLLGRLRSLRRTP
jgi:hypothetical protein